MTTDQIVALIASIGTCLSAIATFLTVRQIAKQREATYHPELAFSRIYFEAGLDPLSVGALPRKWINRKTDDVQAPLTDLLIPFRNVGLGTAKDIRVAWSFEIEKTIKYVNELAQRTLTPAYFNLKNGAMTIKSEGLGDGTSMWSNQQKITLDFVLPASVDKEPTNVSLPHAFIELCSAIVYLDAKNQKFTGNPDCPLLTASIDFVDIGDQAHHVVFDFRLNFVAIVGNGKGFFGFLDITRRI